eukprot:c20353_g1_i3 orf=371-826(+)
MPPLQVVDMPKATPSCLMAPYATHLLNDHERSSHDGQTIQPIVQNPVRRYIASGHIDHFENAGCVLRNSERRTWNIPDVNGIPVTRESIIGDWVSLNKENCASNNTKAVIKHRPLSNVNKDIINHRFAAQEVATLLPITDLNLGSFTPLGN